MATCVTLATLATIKIVNNRTQLITKYLTADCQLPTANCQLPADLSRVA